IQGCTVAIVDLEQDWSLPLNFAERLNAAGARLAMIVNPHAPSGVLLSADAVVEVAEHFNGVLLVDEAYVDFVDPQQNHNLVPRIRDLDNLLLLRTLSKGFSLAGLRFGYGIGSPAVIEPMLTKTRDSYNTDYISQQLAAAAIASVDYGRQIWKQVRKERRRLKDKLEQMGFACPPSQSNFLLATVPPDRDAAALYEMLKQHRILVRYFDQERLRDKLRISVGSAEENQALLRALEISLS
ncbi:MAG: aminotransferase class I/II-fold pyridoxal phosphate-dependent enzyme, partial [Pseudohongiellaceae bacterium]